MPNEFFVLKRHSDNEVVHEGSLQELNAWAIGQGWSFRKDQSLFGGYWRNANGDSWYFAILEYP